MHSDVLARVRRNALATLRPPAKRALSDWLESAVFLPDGVSSTPGRLRLWPFQRAIADAIGDPDIERVTLVKPVRVGFTTLLSGALANYVANDPSPVLSLLPTEADARDYMVSDLEPIFAASPELAGLLAVAGSEGSRNTILSRRFPGGSLKVVAARSPRNLRRHNARVLFIDEADGMEVSAEGSPILLAERRTLSFANRKIVIGSTPTLEETSHVLRSYALSDARVFELPCPECGEHHEPTWGDIQWPDGAPEKACYVCPACGSANEEHHKRAMVEGGRWRATRPAVEGHAGFRMSALISLLPNASWGRLASEFVAVKDDPSRLQTFVNTILGQGWREGGETLDDEALAARAEPFGLEALPDEVLALTGGVDVQRDRLELTVVGWARDDTAFTLAHHVVWGLPDDDATWAELDALLQSRYAHPLGGALGLDAVAVDSGDGETMERVYAFAFPRTRRKVMAIKGAAGNRPWLERSKARVRGGWLWIVGVDGLKAHITGRLAKAGSIRFSDTLERVWFEQLASERAVTRFVRGQPVRRFERIPGRRAEALDCVVYAFAARQAVNLNWDVRRSELQRGVSPERPKVAAVVKSKWLG